MTAEVTSFLLLDANSPSRTIPLEAGLAGSFRFAFEAPPGLFQLSIIADASAFDWEELYLELNDFGNQGVRTGPWDFNLLNKNSPLIPSYWVSVDGEEIGLWFFQRVSLEDLAARRFRGRAAFWLRSPGAHVVEVRPYRPMPLSWLSATIESDPEDTLAAINLEDFDVSALAAHHWTDPNFWHAQKQKLQSTHGPYREPLQRAFQWATETWSDSPHLLPLLVAAAELHDDEAARLRAFAIIDSNLDKPHWSNPNPEGYSHNGDMGAAYALRGLAWVYHAWHHQLGPKREQKLLAKLQLQGQKFLNLALLNRDYWGGSVLQDHGRVSLAAFANAALHLLTVLPEAQNWLAFALPRTFRSTHAMPRDGVLPPSSYCNLFLYLDETSLFRDTLLETSGQDLYDHGPFWEILDYLEAIVRPQDHSMVVAGNGGDKMPLIGGNLFLNRLSTKFGDHRAAYFQSLILATPSGHFHHPTVEHAYYAGALWGFMSYSPAAAETIAPPLDPTPLNHFVDSGFLHYQDPVSDLVLSARCGPWVGYHAYRHATGPCDRMGMAPGSGHFVLAVNGEIRLASPEGGYSLRSGTCTCLLIDGKGQYGDIGYPMSIPSKTHRGEEILSSHWDPVTLTGRATLDLAPAYPEHLGVIQYQREFLLRAGNTIVVRDRVLLHQPRTLSWLFQASESTPIKIQSSEIVHFGEDPALMMEITSLSTDLHLSVHPTRVVWSYSSAANFRPFHHLRADSSVPLTAAVVEFTLRIEEHF